MGYALAQALLGEAGLMNIMTFAIPVSIYIYTIGFFKLTKRPFSYKKICNPIMIATVLGITAGLCGITLPNAITIVLEKASACMAPVSMLLTGIVISKFSLKSVFCNAKAYPLSILRLIIIPTLLGVVLSIFCDAYLLQTAVLFYALPCGLNTVVFPKLVGEKCEIGASLALTSTILACITLPIILSVFNIVG
jgi:predicted permease